MISKITNGRDDDRNKTSNLHFECNLCKDIYPYNIFGRCLPYMKSITFFEDVYMMSNPFSFEESSPVAMGGHCSSCQSVVCMSSVCSIFYKKRYCTKCFEIQQDEFPAELTEIYNRKKLSIAGANT